MTVVQWAYLIFAVVGLACFWRFKSRTAVLICLFGGWAFLPVGHFPPFWPGFEGTDFPYWIIGLGLPSDMLFTKAWVCPVVAVLGVLLFDFKRLRTFRPTWVDLLPALWCLSPLGPALAGRTSDPAAWLGVLYLSATWGITWFLGRVYFADREGLRSVAQAITLSALLYLPLNLIEGIFKPQIYGWVYDPHPYQREGMIRYIGYRPLGFLEHGNQLGMWVAGAALVAVWMAFRERNSIHGTRYQVVIATVLVIMSFAAQSAGAIVLLVVGLLLLVATRWVSPRKLIVGSAVLVALGGGVYASGVVPFRKIAETTPFGQRSLELLRSTGRGSLGYRIAQDEKHLAAAYQTAVLGSGRWDWWRGKTSRPWGQWLLVVGQFGFVGLVAFSGIWLYPAIRTLWSLDAGVVGGAGVQGGLGAVPAVLAMLLLITWADSLLNSFVLLPLLLVAGGLAVGSSTLPIPASRGGDLPQRQVLGGRGGSRVGA